MFYRSVICTLSILAINFSESSEFNFGDIAKIGGGTSNSTRTAPKLVESKTSNFILTVKNLLTESITISTLSGFKENPKSRMGGIDFTVNDPNKKINEKILTDSEWQRSISCEKDESKDIFSITSEGHGAKKICKVEINEHGLPHVHDMCSNCGHEEALKGCYTGIYSNHRGAFFVIIGKDETSVDTFVKENLSTYGMPQQWVKCH